MKKNSLLIICFVLVLGLSFFAFAGCNNVPSAETTGGVSSGENTDGGSTEQPVAPELKNMSYYFSGVKAEYLKNEIKNENNSIVDFNDLLDRQIDVLAQDLIYRLTYVYGYGETNHNRNNVSLELKNFDNQNYNLNGNNAIVDFEKLIIDLTVTNDSLVEVNLNNVDGFQHSVLIINSTNNILMRATAFNLVGAINGNNMAITDLDGAKLLSNNSNKSWLMTSSPSNYETYCVNNKETIKLGIAQILADNKTTSDYDELLSSINNLGYNDKQKDEIVNYIYKNVIGENLVNKDNEYEQYFINNHSGLINSASLSAINADSNFTNEDSARFYKGYNIVIPAIVEQALNNTFENTETSIYPVLNRMAVESTVNADGFADAKKYSSVLLMPKTNAPTTKLIVNLEGVGESVGKTITIDYVVAISTESYHGKITVTLENVNQEIELNLDAITDGAKLNAYNGAKENYTSTDLFGANESSDINDGNNYIKLTFNNTDNAAFKVTFKGMYDKMQ